LRCLFTIALVALISSVGAAHAQDRESASIENLVGKWEIDCAPIGCMMTQKMRLGDPDHPFDPQRPEYIIAKVAIARETKMPDYISFQIPADSDSSGGLVGSFLKLTDSQGKQIDDPRPHSTFSLPVIGPMDDGSLRAVALKGLGESSDANVDLIKEFQQNDLLALTFRRNGELYQTLQALYPFKRDYAVVLSELSKQ
jgi:hypothetical protein